MELLNRVVLLTTVYIQWIIIQTLKNWLQHPSTFGFFFIKPWHNGGVRNIAKGCWKHYGISSGHNNNMLRSCARYISQWKVFQLHNKECLDLFYPSKNGALSARNICRISKKVRICYPYSRFDYNYVWLQLPLGTESSGTMKLCLTCLILSSTFWSNRHLSVLLNRGAKLDQHSSRSLHSDAVVIMKICKCVHNVWS